VQRNENDFSSLKRDYSIKYQPIIYIPSKLLVCVCACVRACVWGDTCWRINSVNILTFAAKHFVIHKYI